jgi:hypothetical protein
MPLSANDLAFWQGRAAEARAAATQMTDPLSRSAMLALAARYERLANRILRGADIFGTAGGMEEKWNGGKDHVQRTDDPRA